MAEGNAKKKNSTVLRRITKTHGIISLCAFLLYVLTGALTDPRFLLSDMKDKYHSAAAAVVSCTARIYGPPVQPVVTATPRCTNNAPDILLNWPQDEFATSNDIFRNSAELTTGLASYQYTDSNVSAGTGYAYYVIARGPEGEATSDNVSATALQCSSGGSGSEGSGTGGQEEAPAPRAIVQTFDSNDLTERKGIMETTDRTPRFTGSTNIPYAIVRILVNSELTIVAETTANANGYWEWVLPQKLPYETHTIQITVVDPEDNSRTATASMTFQVEREESSENDDNEDSNGDETDQETESTASAAVNASGSGTKTGESSGSSKKEGSSKNTENIGQEKTPAEENAEAGNTIQPGSALSAESQQAPAPLDYSVEIKSEGVYQGDNIRFLITVNAVDEMRIGKEQEIIYTIIDQYGKNAGISSERLSLRKGQQLEKELAISSFVEPGKYTLRVEVIGGGYDICCDRCFDVLRKPVVALGGGITFTRAEVVSNLGWISSILLAILAIFSFLMTVEHHAYRHLAFYVSENYLKKRRLIN